MSCLDVSLLLSSRLDVPLGIALPDGFGWFLLDIVFELPSWSKLS